MPDSLAGQATLVGTHLGGEMGLPVSVPAESSDLAGQPVRSSS